MREICWSTCFKSETMVAARRRTGLEQLKPMSATPPYDGTMTNRHVLPENITISASENMSGFRESGVLQGLQASQIFRSRDLCPQTIPVDYRLRAMVCLGGRHPAPERTGIGSIPMKPHHPGEEFARARRLCVEA